MPSNKKCTLTHKAQEKDILIGQLMNDAFWIPKKLLIS